MPHCQHATANQPAAEASHSPNPKRDAEGDAGGSTHALRSPPTCMIMTDASITTATMLNARTPRTRTIEHACSPLRTRESFLWAWRRPVFEAKYDGFQDFSCSGGSGNPKTILVARVNELSRATGAHLTVAASGCQQHHPRRLAAIRPAPSPLSQLTITSDGSHAAASCRGDGAAGRRRGEEGS